MTIAASQPSWTIRTLRPRDRDEAFRLLDRNHELNIYLLARLIESAPDRVSNMVAVFRNSAMVAVATTTANLAVGFDPDLDDSDLEHVAGLIAHELIDRCTYLRAIISPAAVVERLWDHLSHHFEDPTVVRLRQPVYVLDQVGSLPDLRDVRYARLDDLDILVPACASMHSEEIGIDPLSRDAFGYQQRIRDLIEQRRSFVWLEKGRIVFKCEVSAETSDSAQLMGVWTAPPVRRLGYAARGLAQVCGHILRQGRTVTLFVNDFNQPARNLYDRLGFRQIGENRALIW